MTRPEPSERTDGLAGRAAAAFTGYRDGDIRRMDELVALLNPLLWHCARGQGLDAASAQDVVQATWLSLLEHAERIVGGEGQGGGHDRVLASPEERR